MTAPWSPRPDSDLAEDRDLAEASDPVGAPVPPAPVPEPAQAADAVLDELAVLDQLEADLAAVEQAVESLERVAVEGVGGEAAAAQIAAAVSVERFGGSIRAD
jgi:transposase